MPEIIVKASTDTLVDMTYRKIRQDITEELIAYGEKVNINGLCERYGTSPTPIKQALNRLLAEGLVENTPGRGYRVRQFDLRAMDELFDLRLMMELYYAPQAASAVKNSSTLRSRFEKNIRENLELVQSIRSADDFFSAYQIDKEFHELFIQAGGNASALLIYQSMNTHSYAAYLYGRQPKDQTVSGIMEHQELYKSMLAGDTAMVCDRIRSHIENARGKVRLFARMEREGVWDTRF